jgi:hypothetical protein
MQGHGTPLEACFWRNLPVVKKSSFLDRIVNRFRGGAVKVESTTTRSKARNGRSGQVNRVAKEVRSSAVVQPVPEEIIPRSRRKMSDSEDAAIQMTSSFREFAGLLRGVQVRMKDQTGRMDSMDDNLSKLPVTADAQLEVMRGLVGQIEKQNAIQKTMIETFSSLPAVMKDVQESLAKTAQVEGRTAQTLDEFRGTMDRIHGSMDQMVDASKTQADAATALTESNKESFHNIEASTKQGLENLRLDQEDQATRMTRLVDENSKWSRGILVLMVMSLAALVSIFFALVTR